MAEILASNFNNSSNPLKIATLKKTNRAHIQPLNWHPGFAGNYLTTASLIPACRKDGRKGEIKERGLLQPHWGLDGAAAFGLVLCYM